MSALCSHEIVMTTPVPPRRAAIEKRGAAAAKLAINGSLFKKAGQNLRKGQRHTTTDNVDSPARGLAWGLAGSVLRLRYDG